MSDFADLVDLASERLGGAVLAANDEFFAPKENLLKAGEAVWREGEYTDAASGWTAGRPAAAASRATTGASSGSACRACSAASIVDTAHFRGNYPGVLLARSLRRRRLSHARGADRGAPGPRSSPVRRWKGTRRTVSRSAGRRAGESPTCASTSIRTAASPGCGSTARSFRTGDGSPGMAARSISPRSRTAGSCSPAATCSSATATT